MELVISSTMYFKVVQITFSYTRRYEAEDFFALRAKQGVFRLFLLILRLCWCSVVTLVTFSGNLRNFKNYPKNLRIIQKKSQKKIREKKSKKFDKYPKIPQKNKTHQSA